MEGGDRCGNRAEPTPFIKFEEGKLVLHRATAPCPVPALSLEGVPENGGRLEQRRRFWLYNFHEMNAIGLSVKFLDSGDWVERVEL